MKKVAHWKNNFWRRLIGISSLVFIIPFGFLLYQIDVVKEIWEELPGVVSDIWDGKSR